MSVSYLNEIEKGKKYPKIDKVTSLANALETSVEELSSTELRDGLAPVAAWIGGDLVCCHWRFINCDLPNLGTLLYPIRVL